MLISLYSFSGSLYPFGFLQYILYVGLSTAFINKSLDDNGLFRWVCCVVLLSPVFLIYAFYQHRDSLFAIALFAYITMTNKMYDYKALTLASICCLIRPDFELAYLAGVIKYVFALKQKPFSKRTAYLILIISFPVMLSTAIRESGKQFLVLDESRSPYLNTLLLQPLCGVVADKRVFKTFDVSKKQDIDKAYTIASLQQECAIPNIWIEWTESNKFSNLNYSDKKAFYSSSYEAIYSNIPAVIARLAQIYLNAIGIGPEMEGVMDVLDGHCELCPEKFKNMNLQENRFTYLHEFIINFFRMIEVGKFRLNLILFNSMIPLILLLFIHSWGESIRTDALITMVIVRYITILAAPSTQYAYHFPTHLAAFLLLFIAIRTRTQTAYR